VTGSGLWRVWQVLEAARATRVEYRFPDEFNACRVRLRSDTEAVVAERFRYK